MTQGADRRGLILSAIVIYLISLLVLSVTLMYVISVMDYIVSRDAANYWDRSYELSVMIQERGLFRWAAKILSSLDDQHTYLPSVIPSLVFYVFSTDSLRVYSGIIVALYLAPIPVIGAFVISGNRTDRSATEIVATGVAMLAAMYPFAVRLMPTSPDFGGNVFTSLGLLFAGVALHRLADVNHTPRLKPLALTIVGFVTCLFISVVFRRWYAFDAAGMIPCFSIAFLAVGALRGRAFFVLALKALVIAGLAFIVIVSPVLLPKLLSVYSSGIFGGAYDAYRTRYLFWFGVFGYPELASFGVIFALALLLHRRPSRPFLLFVLVGCAIGIVVFLNIQFPANHHFSILWPMLLASISVIVGRLFDRTLSAKMGMALLSGVVAISAIVVALEIPKPKLSRYMAAYRILADKIVENQIPDRRYCVLGNVDVHYSIVEHLWQVKGGYRGALPRSSGRIPEVDFGTADRYGVVALGRVLERCEWIITMEKLRLQHADKFHRILRYHHEKIFDPTSILGRTYEIEDSFEAGFKNPIVFFRRKPDVKLDTEAFKADYFDWLAKDKAKSP